MTKTIAVSAAGRPVGEDSARCRWPDAVVEEIRQRVAAGETVTAAAARFGVPFNTAKGFVRCHRRAVLPAAWVTVRAGRRTVVG
jgi:hypothetical protein